MKTWRELRYKALYKVSWGGRRQRYKQKYKAFSKQRALAAGPAMPVTQDVLEKHGADMRKFVSHVADARLYEASLGLRTQSLHRGVFSDYKNIHKGKTVVLLATGPTLNDFVPMEDVVYVGVNRAFMDERFCLDYLFTQDYLAVSSYIDRVPEAPTLRKAKKFYGILPHRLVEGWVIPESIALRHGAARYYAKPVWDPLCVNKVFAYDLAAEPLSCYGSVVFAAMQFILYTNPEKIYVVGCDTNNAGQFNEPDAQNGLKCSIVLQGWQNIKNFAKMYYPETEIISVNPVGLKGLFREIYTQSNETQ